MNAAMPATATDAASTIAETPIGIAPAGPEQHRGRQPEDTHRHGAEHHHPDPLAEEHGAHRHGSRTDAVEHPQALLLEEAAGDDGDAEEEEQQPDARAHGRGR